MIGILILGYYKKLLVTYSIIIANFVVFVVSLVFPKEVIGDLAFRPLYLTVEYFPQIYTLFTSMFLHSVSDFFHIIFNTLMFFLIAPHFERRIGKSRFIIIYLITGVGAALFHAILSPYLPSPIPFDPRIGLIGASGAISGIIGAYAYSYPRDTVFFPVGFFLMRIPILFAGLFFIVIQSVYIFIGGDPGIAYLAHIGGFISGVIIAAIIKMRSKEEFEDTSTAGYSIYHSQPPSKRKKIDFMDLRKLATTKELKKMLENIEKEDVPQVRDIWRDHFLENIRCPKCQKPLLHDSGKIWCEDDHYTIKY
jgi:membrane associated rhomboid family serine protease